MLLCCELQPAAPLEVALLSSATSAEVDGTFLVSACYQPLAASRHRWQDLPKQLDCLMPRAAASSFVDIACNSASGSLNNPYLIRIIRLQGGHTLHPSTRPLHAARLGC